MKFSKHLHGETGHALRSVQMQRSVQQEGCRWHASQNETREKEQNGRERNGTEKRTKNTDR